MKVREEKEKNRYLSASGRKTLEAARDEWALAPLRLHLEHEDDMLALVQCPNAYSLGIFL